MKFTTPFAALRNATADMWRMHDFNYQLPQKESKNIGIKNAQRILRIVIANFIVINI